MKNTRKVIETEVFEWYDAIVLGIVRTGNQDLATVLLAFDPDTSRRCYALIPLTKKEGQELRSTLKTDGIGFVMQEIGRAHV